MTFYPLELQFTEPSFLRAEEQTTQSPGEERSRQLKIELDRRNHLTRFPFYPDWCRAPALDGINRGIGQDRLSFQNSLHFDATVFGQFDLQRHKTMNSRALGERRIRRGGRMCETPQESIGIFADAAAKPALQVIEKVFNPIPSVFLRLFGLHIVGRRTCDLRPCPHKSERSEE